MSRRGFIQVASVAGAVSLGGCARLFGPRHDVQPTHVRPPDPLGPLAIVAGTRQIVGPRATCIARIDDHSFATCDDVGNMTLWKISETGSVTRDDTFNQDGTFMQHAGKATFVAAAFPWVLTAGYDGTVFVRNLQDNTTRQFTRHKDGNHNDEVWVAAVTHSGMALSATNNGRILQWNAALGNDSPLTHYVDHGRDDPVAGLAFVPPPAPNQPAPTRFLSTHGHGEINLWTLGNGGQPDKTFSHRNSHHVNTIAVTGDGAQFVSAGFDMTLRVWDVNDNNPNPRPLFPALKGHRSWVWRVAISPDNSKAASASADGTVHLWDIGPQVANNQRLLGAGPASVGGRGSMGVIFVNGNFLVYTTDHLDDPNDQVRVFPVPA